ncbi:MAG: hypothetical protein LKK13_03530 [Bacilli bacterium]|jgi:hypothetical protein|nr:hypothetical protein [Bacilli bacterium]
MRKQVLLVLASGALTLAGCAQGSSGAPAVSSSGSDSASATSSKEVSSSLAKPVLSDFLKKFSDANATIAVKVDDSDFLTASFYGERGFYVDAGGDTSSGVIANREEGCFDFTYEDGALILGQAESDLRRVTTAYYTPLDLAGATANFSVEKDGLTYDLTKGTAGDYSTVETAYAILGMCNINWRFAKLGYLADVKLILDADGEGAAFSYEITNVASVTAQISDIGTTENAAFSAYIASPKSAPVRTAYTAESLAAFGDMFGEGAVVPFPSAASALWRDDVVYDDNDVASEVDFYEFGSDISAAFAGELIAAGFKKVTSTSVLGDELVTYEKVYSAATETIGDSVIAVTVSYDAEAERTTGTISSYTYPKRKVDKTVATANEYLTAYNDGAATIPLLSDSTDIVSVTTLDASELVGETLYLQASITIDDETACDAYRQAYQAVLVDAGYEETDEWDELGFKSYEKGDVTIEIDGWFDDSNNFDGGFSIIFEDIG